MIITDPIAVTSARDADEERTEFVTDPAQLVREYRGLVDDDITLMSRLARALVGILQAHGMSYAGAAAAVAVEFGVDVIDHLGEGDAFYPVAQMESAKGLMTLAALAAIAGKPRASELAREALAQLGQARAAIALEGERAGG